MRTSRNRVLLAMLAVALIVLAIVVVWVAKAPPPNPQVAPSSIATSTTDSPTATSTRTSTRTSTKTSTKTSRPGPTSSRPTPQTSTPRVPDGGSTDPVSGLPWIDASSLPKEARQTLALIKAGGPYPYPRNDNQTFSNREQILPPQKRGYYKEFTVTTPGSPDRGPRRIVTGSAGEKYWTDDHYDSFSVIREDP